MILTDSIKTSLALALALLLSLLAALMGLKITGMESQNEKLENEKTTLLAEALIKRMEVQALMDSLGDQEKRIQAFEATAQQMAAARLKAQQEAAQRVQQMQNHIAWLEQDKGASCTAAGIGKTILDEVLP